MRVQKIQFKISTIITNFQWFEWRYLSFNIKGFWMVHRLKCDLSLQTWYWLSYKLCKAKFLNHFLSRVRSYW